MNIRLLPVILSIVLSLPLQAQTASRFEAPGSAWSAYPISRLAQDLGRRPPSLDDVPLQALKRVLSQTQLSPAMLSSASREDQPRLIQEAVKDYAKALAVYSDQPKQQASEPDEFHPLLAELQQARQGIKDIRIVEYVILKDRVPLEERDAVAKPLKRSATNLSEAFQKAAGRLISEQLQRLTDPSQGEWRGRTAVLPLKTGELLAFKWHQTSDSKDREAREMNRARSFGKEAPLPLPSPVNSISHRRADGRFRSGPSLIYLVAKERPRDEFAYLNDKMDSALTRAEKADRLEEAALKSIKDMALLLKNGYIHGSLIPLSHSQAHWEWDFWRYYKWERRFGPTSLHNWRSALSYPNLRLKGLADWEHLAPVSSFERLDEHDGAHHAHDIYSAIGQNLFEWAVVVMDAGVVNGIPSSRIARILSKGIRVHAENFVPPELVAHWNWSAIARRLKSSSRKFRNFSWFAGLWPQHLSDRLNRYLSKNRFFIFLKQVPNGESLVMPGSVLQPLVADVLDPYIKTLRELKTVSGANHFMAVENYFSWALEEVAFNILLLVSLGMTFLFLMVGSLLFRTPNTQPFALVLAAIPTVVVPLSGFFGFISNRYRSHFPLFTKQLPRK